MKLSDIQFDNNGEAEFSFNNNYFIIKETDYVDSYGYDVIVISDDSTVYSTHTNHSLEDYINSL